MNTILGIVMTTGSRREVLVKLLTPTSTKPSKGTPGSAGLDLYCNQPYTIPPRTAAKVSTGIAVQLLQTCYGRIAARSGTAFRNWVSVLAGVIDPDYTAEIIVGLLNKGPEELKLNPGDRIAQLITEVYADSTVVVLDDFDVNKHKNTRGDKGFGSTGL